MSAELPYVRNPLEWTSPTGITTTLYPIGEVAHALGRTPTTIRAWEVGGVIPRTPFTDKRGRRLYSAEHLEAIVKCAEKSRIRSGSRIADTKFTRNTFNEFERINKLVEDLKKEL